jgi:cephalosporin-C deacetylase
MPPFQHSFPFDPTYGYTLETLLEVQPPPAPADFLAFWQARYARALEVQTKPEFRLCKPPTPDMQLYMIRYLSTDGFRIGGWLLKPKYGPLERGVVVGHGYGGREAPDLNLPFPRAALLFPCFRGISLSKRPPVSSDPNFHVLHDIDKTDKYILGGCVEDLWVGVSVLQNLFPELEGRIGYMGRSFGGGIGALALPVETRVARAHLCVPTFGNQPLRLTLPTQGSGEAVRNYAKRLAKHAKQQYRVQGNIQGNIQGNTQNSIQGDLQNNDSVQNDMQNDMQTPIQNNIQNSVQNDVMQTLQYYDAATAATHIQIPMHIAAALFDPVVAPPGQFAIYNALPSRSSPLERPKTLFTLEAGHFDFPGLAQQEAELLEQLHIFFEEL